MRVVTDFVIAGRVTYGACTAVISTMGVRWEQRKRARRKRSKYNIRCPFLSPGATILEGGEPAGDCPSSSGEGAISMSFNCCQDLLSQPRQMTGEPNGHSRFFPFFPVDGAGAFPISSISSVQLMCQYPPCTRPPFLFLLPATHSPPPPFPTTKWKRH